MTQLEYVQYKIGMMKMLGGLSSHNGRFNMITHRQNFKNEITFVLFNFVSKFSNRMFIIEYDVHSEHYSLELRIGWEETHLICDDMDLSECIKLFMEYETYTDSKLKFKDYE